MIRRVLALPPLTLSRNCLDQVLVGLDVRFDTVRPDNFAVQAPETHLAHCATLLGDGQVATRLDETSLFGAEEVVVAMPKLLHPMDLVSLDAQSRGLLVGWPTDAGNQNFVLAVGAGADIFLVDRTGGVRPSAALFRKRMIPACPRTFSTG